MSVKYEGIGFINPYRRFAGFAFQYKDGSGAVNFVGRVSL